VLVTVSGLPGSGTSTVATRIAQQLGVEHLDGGTVFRTIAAERGLALQELSRLAEVDDRIDRALDDRLLERAAKGDLVLESRLAGWLVHNAGLDAHRVWLACDEAERAARVGGRDGQATQEAIAVNRAREASERLRYQQYYGIDLTDLSIYDQVVDTTTTPPDEVVDAVLAAIGAS
jgi:predicted cytidylate kinase